MFWSNTEVSEFYNATKVQRQLKKLVSQHLDNLYISYILNYLFVVETICFSCQAMSSLVLCNHVQKCGPGKVKRVEQIPS